MNDRRHGTSTPVPEPDSVCVPGPWRHRLISANGIHLHVADVLPQRWEERQAPDELPPLVLFLHGYGENWWVWRHQLEPLAAAGYHAMAVDLRGYGDSDKPPRGYDLLTAANDMAGLVRAAGHRDVIVVGHGLGGTIGWTMARMFRNGVTTLVAVSAPHPLSQRYNLLKHFITNPTFTGPLLSAQLPRLPEWRMGTHHWIADYLHKRTMEGWLDSFDGQAALEFFGDALRIPKTAHCANEYLRWVWRSRFRTDGFRYNQKMKRRLGLNVIAIRGEYDPVVSPEDYAASADYVDHLELVTVPNTAFFPQLEAPELFTDTLIHYLGKPAR